MHFNPRPGSVLECLEDSSLRWKCCVVSHTYLTAERGGSEASTVMAAIKQDADITGGLAQGNDPDEVRPVRSAIRATFGETPMWWMQHNVLLAEQQMRFDRFHCFDFEQIAWMKWFSERFFFWVGMRRSEEGGWVPCEPRDERNGPFQALFAAQSAGAQDALYDLMAEPFDLMDKVTTKWFDGCSEEVSCYTYLSTLGHDWIFCFVALSIQIGIPFILISSALKEHSFRMAEDCGVEEDSPIFVHDCIQFSPNGSFLCPQRQNGDAWMGRYMILCIMAFYIAKVVPDQLAIFTGVVGDTEEGLNRMKALRRAVHDLDLDSLLTKSFYRIDKSMNSAYDCLVYALNIMILYFTNSVENILLNSLAIEFVAHIDESFTSMDW